MMETETFELVSDLLEVGENIVQFNADLDNETVIIEQLSQFYRWYYIEGLDMFGPSKYIGFKQMSTERYARGQGKNSGDSTEVLLKWFRPLSPGSNEEVELRKKLEARLADFKKELNKATTIHVLKF
jgi:hypothetical protein